MLVAIISLNLDKFALIKTKKNKIEDKEYGNGEVETKEITAMQGKTQHLVEDDRKKNSLVGKTYRIRKRIKKKKKRNAVCMLFNSGKNCRNIKKNLVHLAKHFTNLVQLLHEPTKTSCEFVLA